MFILTPCLIHEMPSMHASVPPIDTRACDILDRVKAIFAQKGFDGASMKDLAQAAGMSAGNFYRYFPSKDALIAGLVERDVEEVRCEFARILTSQTPRQTFHDIVRHRVEQPDPTRGPIWAEIEATALRRPEIADIFSRKQAEIQGYITAAFAVIAQLPVPEADRRFGDHAKLIMLLVQGLTTRIARPVLEAGAQPDTGLAVLVIDMINRILSELETSPPSPRSNATVSSVSDNVF